MIGGVSQRVGINLKTHKRFPQKVKQIVTWNAVASMPDSGNQYLWHLTPKDYDMDVTELDLQMQAGQKRHYLIRHCIIYII